MISEECMSGFYGNQRNSCCAAKCYWALWLFLPLIASAVLGFSDKKPKEHIYLSQHLLLHSSFVIALYLNCSLI